MREYVFINDEYLVNRYFMIFRGLGLDSIRLLQLKDVSGFIMDQNDADQFRKGVNKFQSEYKRFMKWLRWLDIGGIDIIMSTAGILTFNSLFYYVKDEQDLVRIIGNEYQSAAIIIWNSIQKSYDAQDGGRDVIDS